MGINAIICLWANCRDHFYQAPSARENVKSPLPHGRVSLAAVSTDKNKHVYLMHCVV